MDEGTKPKPIVVVNAAKAFVKTCDERYTHLRLSTEALERLNEVVRSVLKNAAKTAIDHKQRTILARDFE